ncbi:Mu transposase domain-containing protein [Kribbella sp. CA-294648]|uniref:Mu transposase domain-containing protein n=1 Tax=Kribbella sp. CA-294648 TaxID=3239948 RepID=UPI003D8D4C17
MFVPQTRIPARRPRSTSALTQRVDRYAQITVRTNHYSVPSRLIGRQVRVLLNASYLVRRTHRDRRHERLIAKAGSRAGPGPLPLGPDPQTGAMPGSTALEQARATGKFTRSMDPWWAAACNAHGYALALGH